MVSNKIFLIIKRSLTVIIVWGLMLGGLFINTNSFFSLNVCADSGAPPINGTTTEIWYIDGHVVRNNEWINTSDIQINDTASMDWTNVIVEVNGNITVNATGYFNMTNCDLILNGNFTINGTVTFQNVTLKMNCTVDGQYHIEVFGSIYIYDSDNDNTTTNDASEITAYNTNYEYLFWVRSGANFVMKNSGLYECGWGEPNNGLIIETNGTIIENNTITNNHYGLYLDFSSNNKIVNNTCSNNKVGIYLDNLSNNNIITDNNCLNNYWGIQLCYSSNNTIANNKCLSYWYGITVAFDSLNNTILNNNCSNNNRDGISIHTSSNSNTIMNNTCYLNNEHGINIHSSSNNTIINNTIKSNNEGLYLSSSTHNNITKNNFFDNINGIRFESTSENNNIFNNTIIKSNPQYGLFLDLSSLNNNISNNNTVNSEKIQYYFGLIGTSTSPIIIENEVVDVPNMTNLGQFIVVNCMYLNIDNCTFKNGSNGIYVCGSNNISLLNNTVNLNYESGIYLTSSHYCNITNNNVSDNTDRGIYIQRSNNTRIINNTLLSNNIGIYLTSSSNSNNINNNNLSKNNYGIYLTSSLKNNIINNTISNITRDDVGWKVQGKNAIGIYLLSSFSNNISSNTINSIKGGTGGMGGSYQLPGRGGIGAGIYLKSSFSNDINSNIIFNIVGGKGGFGEIEGSGGVGGLSVGIFLISSKYNDIRSNNILNLSGGEGGSGKSKGTDGIAYGIYIDPYSLDNNITIFNTLDGDNIIYYYNQSNKTINNQILTANSNPTNYGKITLINCNNFTIYNNTIANLNGEPGKTGLYWGPGTDSKKCSGIYLEDSINNNIYLNNISNISGGIGGTGGNCGSGGSGGLGIGIFLKSSNNNNISLCTISNISGGIGGKGGNWAPGGVGGRGSGIYFENSVNNNITSNEILKIYGGKGGAGYSGGKSTSDGAIGNGYGIYIDEYSLNNQITTNNTMDGDKVIYYYNNSNITIKNNILISNSNPTNFGKITLIKCNNFTIYNNTLANYLGKTGRTYGGIDARGVGENGGLGGGIYLVDSVKNNITSNKITNISGGTGGTGGALGNGGNCGIGTGIYLKSSDDNLIFSNLISNMSNGTGGIGGIGTFSKAGKGGKGGINQGIHLSSSTNNTIISNTIFNLSGGSGGKGGSGGGSSWMGGPGGDGGIGVGIYSEYSFKNIIESNDIRNILGGEGGIGGDGGSNLDGPKGPNGIGTAISLFEDTNNNISHNIVKSNHYGIYLTDSSNYNNITNCNISNNYYAGIWIKTSLENKIANCNLSNNYNYGLHLQESSINNTIINCNISYNKEGIYLQDLSNAIIHYNKILNNAIYGINNTSPSISVDATYNWWGVLLGPYHPITNPTGTGDNVSNYVIYRPWLPLRSPTIDNTDVTQATEDEEYKVIYTSTDPNLDPIIWKYSSNASWLNWGITNNTLYGIPTNADVGSYWVCMNITDGNEGYDEHNFTLIVSNVNPLIVTSDIVTSSEDLLYYNDYDSDDDGQGTIVWSLNTNATWLVINSITGVLNGTPDNDDIGKFWINVTVNDGNGGLDFSNFTLTVINTNDAPIIDTTEITTIYEDEYYEVIHTATEMDIGDILTWTYNSNASWLNWDPENHTIFGTPKNNDVGTYWIRINISDGNGGYDEHYFILTVINTNDAPFIDTSDTLLTNEDEFYEVHYTATDIDIGDSLFWTYDSNADWLYWGSNNHTLYGTPGNEDVGEYWVRINISDGNGGYDEHYFILTVSNVNDAPTIMNAPKTLNINARENITLDLSKYVDDVDNDTSELVLQTNSKYSKIDRLFIIFKYPNSVSTENVEITVTDDIDISLPHNILITIIPNITHPIITEKSPTGSNVFVTSNITITFSDPMLKSTVEDALLIIPTIVGESNWIDNTIIFNPNEKLLYNTTYTILIDTFVKDLEGDPLEDPYEWNFTTEVLDTDKDGIPDDQDRDDDNDGFLDIWEEFLVTDSLNPDDKPIDTDNDGKPNGDDINSKPWMDFDDDNDNISDKNEFINGTNPLLKDTDGDGYNDDIDEFPLDSTKWKKQEETEPIDYIWIVFTLLIIIIIVIILIFFFIKRKRPKKEITVEEEKRPKEEAPPEQVPAPETPPPEQPPTPEVTPQVTQPQVEPAPEPVPMPQVEEQPPPTPQVQQPQVEVQEPQGQAPVPKIKTQPTIKENYPQVNGPARAPRH